MARALLAVLAALIWGSAAEARPISNGGATIETIAGAVRSAGYVPQIVEGKTGRYIRTGVSGMIFLVYPLNCKAVVARPATAARYRRVRFGRQVRIAPGRAATVVTRCATVQFYSGVADRLASHAHMNRFNHDHRFARAYIDDAGEAVMEMDVDIDRGSSTEAIVDNLVIWETLLSQFNAFLRPLPVR